jgi:hypothetical protein
MKLGAQQITMVNNYKGYEANVIKTKLIELSKLVGAHSKKDGDKLYSLAIDIEQWQNKVTI